MERRNISPFTILLFKCFVGMITTVLFILVVHHIHCTSVFTSINNLCQQNDSITSFAIFEVFPKLKSLLSIIGFMVLIGLFHLFAKLTNYYFTPTQRKMTDIIRTFGSWVYSLITSKSQSTFSLTQILLALVGYVIILFGIMFFNELLIWYQCRMETNMQKEIIKRAKEEIPIEALFAINGSFTESTLEN